jgi:secreted trypsin-like serine protease
VDPRNYMILVGTVDRTKGLDQAIRVKNFTWQNQTVYDIAVVELAQPLNYSKDVQPVCLPQKYQEQYHEEEVVIGWGYDLKRAPTNAEESMVPAGARSECAKKLDDPSFDSKKYICAGAVNRGTEGGDSGSPMLQNVKGRWWQVGLTSSGVPAPVSVGNGSYYDVGVYARISPGCEWIRKVTKGEVKCQDMTHSKPVSMPTSKPATTASATTESIKNEESTNEPVTAESSTPESTTSPTDEPSTTINDV